jgi:voltage-gated potassium channel
VKALVSVVSTFLESRNSRQNLLTLFKLLLMFFGLLVSFSVLFHVIMEREDQHHSWVTGFYWTLTVMSTLGFGDITFHSDLGRLFSIIVLVTGVVFLLVLLPFTFIEFFYAPWMRAQAIAQAPRELPLKTSRHVILTHYGPVTKMLIRLLEKHKYPYFVLVPVLSEALEMRDRDLPVVMGELSDPETYRKLRADQAAMVVTTRDDIINTNVTFSVREIAPHIPIIASARSTAARDALELAGVTHILSLEEMMGQALSRRVIGGDSCAEIIHEMKELVIAEASAAGTTLIGQTVAACKIGALTGVTVVGLWERGKLVPAEPTSQITEHTFFILAGARSQVDAYNRHFGKPRPADRKKSKVVIIGGGRVGRATARSLDEENTEWTMIEKLAERVQFPDKTIVGDGSEFELLVKAGLHDAASVIITTHDDDTNIFLTIFYRKLRPNTQIISRCTHEANVNRLHRAGADLVLSYASMGANTIFNFLKGRDTVLLAEGVTVFTANVPKAIVGQSLAEANFRAKTSCSIIAIEVDGVRNISLDPRTILPPKSRLVLVGSAEAEERFRNAFPAI